MNQQLLILLIAAIALLSCEKIIQPPNDELEILNSQEDFNIAINGAYMHLASALKYNNYLSIKSDDIAIVRAQSLGSPSNYLGIVPMQTTFSIEFYQHMYLSLLMCNKIIDNIERYKTEGFKNPYLGEAYFLRAYIHYKLSLFYGKIPIITNVFVSYEIALSGYADIYQQIEADLLESLKYLSENRFNSREGCRTPYKATAYALLGEVYLKMAGYPLYDETKYANAVEITGNLIAQSTKYGLKLQDDFADNWRWETKENNESLWLIYYDCDNYSIGNALTHFSNTLLPEPSFLRNFPSGYRKNMSFWYHYKTEHCIGNDSGEVCIPLWKPADKTTDYDIFYSVVAGKKQIVNGPSSFVNTGYMETELNPMAYRAHYNAVLNNPFNQEVKSIIQYFHIFRYAHTLLTYAEAKARMGEPDKSAFEAVNMVRRRANRCPVDKPSNFDLPFTLTQEAFIDSVVQERAWEFCHEFEGRWNDIVRLQLYESVEQKRLSGEFWSKDIDKLYFGTNEYFIPLPKVDEWLNPNLQED